MQASAQGNYTVFAKDEDSAGRVKFLLI